MHRHDLGTAYGRERTQSNALARAIAGERKLWVLGGGNVASQFADAGLLEQVCVTIVPVVLGTGKPLFAHRLPGPPMRLTAALPRPSGMIELRYQVIT